MVKIKWYALLIACAVNAAYANQALLLVTFDRNRVLSIQAYDLEELADEMNYLSREYARRHMLFEVNLKERGSKVTAMNIAAEYPYDVKLEIQRGKITVPWLLSWHSVEKNDIICSATRTICDVQIANDRPIAGNEEQATVAWTSLIELAWHDEVDTRMHIVCEEAVSLVCACIVNKSFVQELIPYVTVTKQEALEMGILHAENKAALEHGTLTIDAVTQEIAEVMAEEQATAPSPIEQFASDHLELSEIGATAPQDGLEELTQEPFVINVNCKPENHAIIEQQFNEALPMVIDGAEDLIEAEIEGYPEVLSWGQWSGHIKDGILAWLGFY